MRILFAITKGETGGAQEHLRILANGLADSGHAVAVATTVPSDLASSLPASVEIAPWKSIVRDPHPLRDLRARRELRAIVERFEPDVLHLYSAKAGVVGRALVDRSATRTIYTCHHAPFGAGRELTHRLLSRPIEQMTLRWLDGIVTDGGRDVPLLRKIAPRVPIRTIPNAVGIDEPPLSPEEPAKVALWVARMRRPKDPLRAVEAWERVHKDHPDAYFLMCGEGPLLEELRERVRRSSARTSIEVLGRVPSLSEQLARASVFVLATDVEGGTTMATLEAMAHGLVPVISDAGDSWILERERAGIVVPRRSPRAMGAAISALFDDQARLRAMRPNAIRFARETWTVEDFVRATAAFYGDVIGTLPDDRRLRRGLQLANGRAPRSARATHTRG